MFVNSENSENSPPPKASSPARSSISVVVAPATVEKLILAHPRPVGQCPVGAYIKSLGSGSQLTMVKALNILTRLLMGGRCSMVFVDWAALRPEHTLALRTALASKYAPATSSKILSALRGVLKSAWKLGQMSFEEYQQTTQWQTVRRQQSRRGRVLTEHEVLALFSACFRDYYRCACRPVTVRDAAVLAVLYGAGLRRSEVVALDIGDYNPKTGRLVVRSPDGSMRSVYAGCGMRWALQGWLVLRGMEPGPFFLPVLKSGCLVHRRLTTQAILGLLTKRSKEAGVRPLSPHDLRRTFMRHLLDAGVDSHTVNALAGLANVTANVAATAEERALAERKKKKAARSLKLLKMLFNKGYVYYVSRYSKPS